jgi:hypothetical protein
MQGNCHFWVLTDHSKFSLKGSPALSSTFFNAMVLVGLFQSDWPTCLANIVIRTAIGGFWPKWQWRF